MSCDFWCFVALTHGVVGWSRCVIVVFLDHTHLPSTYFLHTHPYFNQDSAKEWDRGYPWELGGYYATPRAYNMSCGILTRTVRSVVVGHVVLAIH